MNFTQFEAIATLISSREPAKSAARRVLVDRVGNIEAAREFALSRQSVSNTVARFRAAEAIIKTAYLPPNKDVDVHVETCTLHSLEDEIVREVRGSNRITCAHNLTGNRPGEIEMSKDDGMEEFHEACAEEIATRAARLVAARDMPRDEAIQTVTEQLRQEREADGDPTGTLATMIRDVSPSKKSPQSQIDAIKNELMDAARDAAETL